MENLKEKYDTELLKYQQVIMATSKENYYTELCNTIIQGGDLISGLESHERR